MKVVLSNVTKHHAPHAALTLHRLGVLRRFVTSIYAKSGSLRVAALRHLLPRSGDDRDVTRLEGRRIEGLPDGKVVSIMWPEIAEQAWHRAKPLHRIAPRASATFLKSEAFDRQVAALHVRECDVFHGFEQCAEFSMRRAKRLGAVTVLDMPVIYRGLWDELDAEERAVVGLPTLSQPFWFRQHVERKYREIELADHLLVGLDFVARSFVDAGFPAERVSLIPYGVDAGDRFVPVQRRGRDTFNILFVGQVSWYKGLRYLLDAYERLDVPGAKLSVVGLIHPEWHDYFERRFAAVSKPFEYLRAVPSKDMPARYAEADVFAFPSLGGGIGLATYEAMATGLPIITSDGDVVIRDGVDGLVRDPRDVDAWVEALTMLNEDLPLRARLGAQAASRVREFTWDAYRAGLERAYRGIGEMGYR